MCLDEEVEIDNAYFNRKAHAVPLNNFTLLHPPIQEVIHLLHQKELWAGFL